MIDYSNYKTIKDISIELSISKQALHKRIKNEPLCSLLASHIIQKGNTVFIHIDGVNVIKSYLLKNIEVDDADDSIDDIDGIVIDKVDDIDDSRETIVYDVGDVDSSIKVKVDDIDDVQNKEFLNKYILSLEEQVKSLNEELKQEREHNRQQAEKFADISDKLAELTRNSQILLKQEQDKTTLLLPDHSESSIESAGDKVKRPFWQFWKNGNRKD